MSQLTEEEKRAVLNQVPIAVSSHTQERDTRAVVCVPPRAEGENERWVGVNRFSRQIDINIQQPNQNRTVLQAGEGNGHNAIYYFYFDQLPSRIMWTIIATVYLSILTSPVILLCCIPMVMKMKRVI